MWKEYAREDMFWIGEGYWLLNGVFRKSIVRMSFPQNTQNS